MYGRAQLNTPLGCRGIFGLSEGAFPVTGSMRNSMSNRLVCSVQKQSASFLAVEADLGFEAC